LILADPLTPAGLSFLIYFRLTNLMFGKLSISQLTNGLQPV
jgi:hypothetical protein